MCLIWALGQEEYTLNLECLCQKVREVLKKIEAF